MLFEEPPLRALRKCVAFIARVLGGCDVFSRGTALVRACCVTVELLDESGARRGSVSARLELEETDPRTAYAEKQPSPSWGEAAAWTLCADDDDKALTDCDDESDDDSGSPGGNTRPVSVSNSPAPARRCTPRPRSQTVGGCRGNASRV